MQVCMEQILRTEPKLSESVVIGSTTIKRLNCCTQNDESFADGQSMDLNDDEYEVEYLEITDEEWRNKLMEAIQNEQNESDECGELHCKLL